MKRKIVELTVTALICAVFPLVIIPAVFNFFPSANTYSNTVPTTQIIKQDDGKYDIVLVQMDECLKEMPLEEYILGVVLAEMPATFHPEAMKAQAVVARTYTFRRMLSGGKHDLADVCVQSSCCQSYRSTEDFLGSGGTQRKLDSIKDAVAETAGQILVYDDAPIEATYFSCSGGSTEDAVAVWGRDVPYLKAISSPGEENAKYYTETVQLSVFTLADKLGIRLGSIQDFKIGGITYTAGGGVDQIVICGKTFQGTAVRKLLGIRSTAFVITVAGNTATITTKGYGHRVGMSQYGAQAMGNAGSSYQEILFYYYQGVDLKTIDGFC